MTTFYERLRTAADERPRGTPPDKVIVRRADLREILFHFFRLDGEARQHHEARTLGEVMAAQRRVAAWVCNCFGRTAMANAERATRLLEEAIELAQAEGVPADLAHRLTDAVYAKPAGNPEQEAAGVGVCLLAWAASAGVDSWELTQAEIARIHTKTPEHFRARHKIKSDAGVALPSIEDAGQ